MILAVSLILYSCDGQESALEGTWELTGYSYSKYALDESFFEEGSGSNFSVTITFENNIMTSTGSFDLYMEKTISGETESIVYRNQTLYRGSSGWSMDGDYIYIGTNERGILMDYKDSDMILVDEYLSDEANIKIEIRLQRSGQ